MVWCPSRKTLPPPPLSRLLTHSFFFKKRKRAVGHLACGPVCQSLLFEWSVALTGHAEIFHLVSRFGVIFLNTLNGLLMICRWHVVLRLLVTVVSSKWPHSYPLLHPRVGQSRELGVSDLGWTLLVFCGLEWISEHLWASAFPPVRCGLSQWVCWLQEDFQMTCGEVSRVAHGGCAIKGRYC